jgi:hypothetical protein
LRANTVLASAGAVYDKSLGQRRAAACFFYSFHVLLGRVVGELFYASGATI